MTDATTNQRPSLPKFLDTDQLAAALQIPKATLEFWRVKGTGPDFLQIGRKVFYLEPAVEAWIESLDKTRRGR